MKTREPSKNKTDASQRGRVIQGNFQKRNGSFLVPTRPWWTPVLDWAYQVDIRAPWVIRLLALIAVLVLSMLVL